MSKASRLAGRGLGAFNAAIAVPVAYLGAITAISWCASRRDKTCEHQPPVTRFVVLVPAHNEETTIATMLESMSAQSYPGALFDVHVVADNCTDGTADIVRAHGAEAHERDDLGTPGKGPALNWLLQRLMERGDSFDVAAFVDADTSVDAEFLAAMDRRFQHGSAAVQGHYGVREAFESAPAALRYCALACRHHTRPIGRNAIGGSCGLFGNGMAFRRDIIVQRDWTAHLVEDMEFQLELLLAGINVDYEPEAKVQAEMPHTFDASVTQHQRWETGRAQIARTYLPRLALRLMAPGPTSRIAVADAALDMAVPPLSVLAAATVVSASAGAVMAAVAPRSRSTAQLVVGLAFVGTIGMHVAVALRMANAPKEAYRALLRAPQLVLWKLRMLFASAIGRGSAGWIRTQRNAETDGRTIDVGLPQ